MRVLVFSSLFPNNVEPIHGNFIKERMARVARLAELTVVAPVPYYPPIKFGWRAKYNLVSARETIEGMQVYHPRYLVIPKIGMWLQGWLMYLSVVRFVSALHRQVNFELVDAHYVYPDGFAGVLLGRRLETPVVVSARGSDINQFSLFPLIRRFLKATLHRADRVIAVSDALKRAIVSLNTPEHKVAVISNGVDGEQFSQGSRQEARKLVGLPEHRKVILSIGSLRPVKGFDLLLRAFKALSQQQAGEPPLLIIIGEGILRAQLERQIAADGLMSSVRLVGAVPHGQLRHWFNAADLFCLASEIEGTPNVILESLSCGTPVVATKVGGIPEMINSDALGLLVPRDEAALAAALAQGLSRDWDNAAIADAVKARTWEAVAKNVMSVFAEAVAAGRGKIAEVSLP